MLQERLTQNKELKETIINNTLPKSKIFSGKNLRSKEKNKSYQIVLDWFKGGN